MIFKLAVLGLVITSFTFGYQTAMWRVGDWLSGVEERLEALVGSSDTSPDDTPTDETHPSSLYRDED